MRQLTATALGRALDRVMHCCSTSGRSSQRRVDTLDSSALKAARVMARTMASNQTMHRNRTCVSDSSHHGFQPVWHHACSATAAFQAGPSAILLFCGPQPSADSGGSSNQCLATSRIPVRLIYGHGGPGNMVGPRMASVGGQAEHINAWKQQSCKCRSGAHNNAGRPGRAHKLKRHVYMEATSMWSDCRNGARKNGVITGRPDRAHKFKRHRWKQQACGLTAGQERSIRGGREPAHVCRASIGTEHRMLGEMMAERIPRLCS